MIGCTVYYLEKMFTTPHLDSHSTTDPKPEIQSAVLTGNRISRDRRNVRGIMHVHMCRKDDTFRQRRLNHSGGIAFRRVYLARAYSTIVVLVFFSHGRVLEELLLLKRKVLLHVCKHAFRTIIPAIVPA